MKRLQTTTLTEVTLAALADPPTTLGSYTADADREVGISLLLASSGADAANAETYAIFASITRTGYDESNASEYAGIFGALAVSDNESAAHRLMTAPGEDFPAWAITPVRFCLHTGDVLKIKATVTAVATQIASGFVEFYGTETLAEIAAEISTLLNTAIPGSPTANSVYERIVAIDDLTQASGAGDLAALLTRIGTPANIDSGGATIADNLKKIADDNGGASFDATTDSLTALRDENVAEHDATQAAIAAIGSGTGAALNFAVAEDNASAPIKSVTAVGTPTGTYANTLADDGTTHQIASVGNALDWVYGFNVGAARAASKVVLRGNMAATGDTVTVSAYNFGTTAWDTRTTITGTAETLRDIPLLAGHTGTGADEGKVYIRFVFAEGDAGTLVIDEAYVQAQQSGSLIGYLDGLVWVDATTGTAGTTPYVNGTADNPCTTIADAYAIAAAVGLTGLHIAAGTTLTLTQSADKWTFRGPGRVALGGQSIADTLFEGLYTISGASTGDDVIFENCGIADATIYHAYFQWCRMKGTLTLAASQAYFFDRCFDANESDAVQTLVFAANANAMLRDWRGGIKLDALAATNECIIDGAGRLQLTDASVGGSVTVRGFFPTITGGAGLHTEAEFVAHGGTLTQTARFATDNTIVANVTQISGDGTAADNAEAFFDGTGYAGTNNVIPTVTTTGTATNLTNAPTNGDLTAAMKTSVQTAATAATPIAASVTGAVGSVTGNVGGNVVGSVGSVTGDTKQTADVATLITTVGVAGAGLTTLATQTSVNDLPTNAELTTALGTADDATLAAIAALNNLSSAQAQSAATAALNAYDPPTNTEFEARSLPSADYVVVGDLAGISVDAQDVRDALKLAPSAGAAAAGSIDAQLAAIAASGAGSGTGSYTDTITDGVNPLDGVRVQLSTDSAGANRVYETFTDALGVFSLSPDPGTYYVWLDLAGHTFPGVAVVVT